MKPVTVWTIRQRRWSVFWWSLALVILIIFTMAFYPTIRDQADQLEKSFSQLSNTTVSLFSDTKQIFSPVGYLSSQIFYLTLPMILSVLTIGLGSSLIAKEEESGTIEMLLARPLARGRLILGKTLAALAILGIVSFWALLSLLIMAKLVSITVPLPAIIMAMLAAMAMALLFGAISFMVTCLGRTARAASIGIAALFAVGGYIISSLSEAVSWLRWPSVISPFHYYHPAEILSGDYHLEELAGLVGVSLLLGVISWWAFRRRDLGGS
ncbi:MAG TPA: ABC transporter permease subunit [Candidatus Saccharimonadales bacterium]|nr:ABC transporter permease subunit [Candidatus Saccharimonadales bacterium]